MTDFDNNIEIDELVQTTSRVSKKRKNRFFASKKRKLNRLTLSMRAKKVRSQRDKHKNLTQRDYRALLSTTPVHQLAA